MSEILNFPTKQIVQVEADPVAPGVAEMFARNLANIASMEGFLDRIDYAAETVRDIHVLMFANVIDRTQFHDMAGQVRELLAADLGTLATPG